MGGLTPESLPSSCSALSLRGQTQLRPAWEPQLLSFVVQNLNTVIGIWTQARASRPGRLLGWAAQSGAAVGSRPAGGQWSAGEGDARSGHEAHPLEQTGELLG